MYLLLKADFSLFNVHVHNSVHIISPAPPFTVTDFHTVELVVLIFKVIITTDFYCILQLDFKQDITRPQVEISHLVRLLFGVIIGNLHICYYV